MKFGQQAGHGDARMMSTNAVLQEVDRETPDAERLAALRKVSESEPGVARRAAWEWLKSLQSSSEHFRLEDVFALGMAPQGPDGHCEGIVMNLYGSRWLAGLDRLVRLGQWLGGVGWTGKSFDLAAGTGYNRLTASTRIPAFLAMPTYRFRRRNGELTGFPFFHSIEESPLPPHPQVRAVKYDAPEHANPLVLPRTRDELVELLPGVYLGRALLRTGRHWRVVGYFGLRAPGDD
jgi:hypothetical protein